jgi:glycosyltransferase involved in cell wall biosynthesis
MRLHAAVEDRTPLERIGVAPSGSPAPRAASPDAVAAARRELGIGEDARVIGVISRFRHEKGLDVLLRAIRSLHDLNGVHLFLAGTGPEEAALRALAAQAPMPVHFLGHRDDLEVWYAVSDVIVIPSRRESFSRAALEAMAAGRPLVATRVGGLVDAIVDGETGLLVPHADDAAVAAALRTILVDRELAARMSAAARDRYQTRYTIAHMAAGRRDAWERAVAAVRPKR